MIAVLTLGMRCFFENVLDIPVPVIIDQDYVFFGRLCGVN